MSTANYKYAVIGGGLAGASAVKAIRERDSKGPLILISGERHFPYDRPPLSKKLWFGKKKVEDIFVLDKDFCASNNIEIAAGVQVQEIDTAAKTFRDSQGSDYGYERLLIATGGVPRRLSIPGGDLDGIYYYRYLDDYLTLRPQIAGRVSVVVIGGGFIGSELAAALSINGAQVTMAFPGKHLVDRVFSDGLGRALQAEYENRGIRVLSGDTPESIEQVDGGFVTNTRAGERLESQVVIAGIGILPSVDLAEAAGIRVDNGIVVDNLLQSSAPGVYAAGDVANFPYTALGRQTRVEHWDNAVTQGSAAGANMAGANERYDHMPYFFSDLFDFGYEAVGEVDARLETFADWQEENKTGVIYYLSDARVRGVMLCNVWDKVDQARDLIRSGKTFISEDLRGAIGFD